MKAFNRKNPFKTPEGYFEGLPDRLMDRISEKGPRIPENDGFRVPDGYFEGLHDKILAKTGS